MEDLLLPLWITLAIAVVLLLLMRAQMARCRALCRALAAQHRNAQAGTVTRIRDLSRTIAGTIEQGETPAMQPCLAQVRDLFYRGDAGEASGDDASGARGGDQV